MKLLIIGGSSFLGRHLLGRICFTSHPFDRVEATFLSAGDFPSFCRRREAEAIRVDLLGEVPRMQADVCVYLAGNSDPTRAFRDPLGDRVLNVTALENCIRHLDCDRFVYLSSAAVYQGLSGRVSPSCRPAPTHPYGASKLSAERLLYELREGGRMSSLVVLRLFYAFGRYEKPRRLIPRIVSAFLEGEEVFSLRTNGSEVLDPLEADFVADVILKSAVSGFEGCFDLCGGNGTTVFEVAEMVVRAAGGGMVIRKGDGKDPWALECVASPGALIDRLGVSIPPLENSIERYVGEWMFRRRMLCRVRR